MCGRFTLTASARSLRDLFPLLDFAELVPRYNIAPTQDVLAVRLGHETGKPELAHLPWGLIPAWADDPATGNRLINARSETVETLPAFRSSFKDRRCLVLADGFFEWQKAGDHKQPYHIRLTDGKPFAFAGLWDRWRRDAKAIESCTVLTTDSNELVRPLHDRMPVILDPAAFDRWLHVSSKEAGDLKDLLVPFPADRMAALAVSTRVNNVRNDDAACLAPSEPGRELSLFE